MTSADGEGISGPRRAVITVSVMTASIMQALDNTIANVALPRIRGSLSATEDQMTWVLTSYIVAAAIMTPLSGWLASRMGRKRVFLASAAGFTIASMLCGLAQSLPEIVLARLLQGVCGASLIPMSQAVLLDVNPPTRHARAMAVWAMGVTIGPILGPALGGWLTENYSWRWVFFINVPVGIVTVLGLFGSLPESGRRKVPFDFFGFAALSLAVGALQLMLDRGQLKDWWSSPEICVEAAVAAVACYLFLIHMLTARSAQFISLALFKDRNFLTGNFFIFFIGVVMFATLALLPPLLQDLLGYPVVTTGLVTAPRGLGALAAMFFVGRIMRWVDARVIIAAGLAITSLSMWQMSGFDLQMDTSRVVISGLVQGLGIGLLYVPMASVTFATLAPALRNEGTALFSLTRNLGSSIGISAVETLLTRNIQINHATLAEHITPYSAIIRAQAPHGVATLQSLTLMNAAVSEQAAMIAYNNDFKLMMVLSLAAIPLILLLKKARAPADRVVID